jgi:hypothetical protein
MKIYLALFTVASVTFATSAFALNCPNLNGDYSCVLADYPTVHEDMSIEQTGNVLTMDADKFVVDGQSHFGAFGSRYVIQCSGNSLYFHVAGLLGQSATETYSFSANGQLIVMRSEASSAAAKPSKICTRK